MPLSPLTTAQDSPSTHRSIILAIACGVGIVILPALALGSLPTKIAFLVFGLCVLQGLWRGASELAGLVAGSLLAIPLAPAIGRGVEGLVGGLFNTSGIANRLLAAGLVALLIVAAVSIGIGIGARRIMKQRPEWHAWNKYAGAGLGGVEGVILAMLVLWIPLALEPIAASQLERREQWMEDADAPAPSPLAAGLVKFAREARESTLGDMAEATNPVVNSRLLSLARDFAAVTRDREAMAHLMDSAVMVEIRSLPSMNTALERLRADEEINASVFGPQGVTPGFLARIVQSPTVLAIFDTTTVIDDLTPRADRLEAAVRAAKGIIDARPK